MTKGDLLACATENEIQVWELSEKKDGPAEKKLPPAN